MKSDIEKSFICINCKKEVSTKGNIGTKNRNHCPFCLHSKHVDEINAGDRLSKCEGNMVPVGVTFKNQPKDKYGNQKPGEIMIVHVCEKCGKVNFNRIASDDNPEEILKLTETDSVTEEIKKEVKKQLFGKD